MTNSFVKRSAIALAAIVAALLLQGCRQRDEIVGTFTLPSAPDAATQRKIVAAAAKIDGVDTNSATFEGTNFVIRFDSMKLGSKNILHAVRDVGVEMDDLTPPIPAR